MTSRVVRVLTGRVSSGRSVSGESGFLATNHFLRVVTTIIVAPLPSWVGLQSRASLRILFVATVRTPVLEAWLKGD